MKANKSAFNLQRQNEIFELLRTQKRVAVADLAARFQMSEVTIRSDLNALAKDPAVVRTHGGAMYVEQFRRDVFAGSEERRANGLQEDAFDMVGGLLYEGDVVFVDGTLPTDQMFRILRSFAETTVITGNVGLATRLAERTSLHVIILGGSIDSRKMTVVAERADYLLEGINISKAILGARGYSKEAGFTDSDQLGAQLKRWVVSQSQEVYILLDEGRFGTVSLATFASAEDVDGVIADRIPDKQRAHLVGQKVRIMETDAKPVDAEGSSRVVESGHPVFEKYRRYAMRGASYPGSPGKGRRIAFASAFRDEPFCMAVEGSIREQSALAGFADKDVQIFDNEYDPRKAIENADLVLKTHPDVFVEFQIDFKTNSLIRAKFEKQPTKIVSLEIPMHGAHYIGVDDWRTGVLAGKTAYSLMKKKWGGWVPGTLIVVFQMLVGGEATMLRGEGFLEAFQDEAGLAVDDAILRPDIGDGNEAAVAAAVDRLVSDYPEPRRMVLTAITERGMRRVVRALQDRGRWNQEDFVIVGHGCDPETQKYIRSGLFDASVAYFPERYGEYVVPLACTLLEGKHAPPYVFVDNAVIDSSNIDEYYGPTGG